MLLADLGTGFLLGGLILVLFSGGAALRAALADEEPRARLARSAFYGTAVAVAAASAVLAAALLGHDFSIAFVTSTTDRSMSAPLLLASFWGGQEGSLLYWALLLTLLGSVALSSAGRSPRLAAFANVFLAGIAAFLLVVLVFVASPFELLPVTPADGLGLNPVLRDGGMLIHPPLLLAGYSSFAIPFCFAMASLAAGRLDRGWLALTRRYALLAWGLQSVGLALGMWWSYHVLGWGGYWEWDPVENAALMPWLATTAYLHSAQVQERRQALRAWNYGLVIVSFLLTVLGTYIVRSGVLPSVHSFAVSPIGAWFFGFLALCVAVSGAMLALRSQVLVSPQRVERVASREGAFLVQNVLLAALCAAILWGTLLPLLTGMLGAPLGVGPAYFDRVAAPFFLALLALMAAGPLARWGGKGPWARSLRWPVVAWALALAGLLAAGVRQPWALLALPLVAAGLATCAREYWRGARTLRRLAVSSSGRALRALAGQRRRYGAFLAHVGILVVAAGLVGSNVWHQQREVTLRPGQSVSLGGHTLVYEGTFRRLEGDHVAVVARVRLDGSAQLKPSIVTYPSAGDDRVDRAAIQTSVWGDIYVVLVGLQGQRASLNLFDNPMVAWIWAGAAIMVGGMLLGNLRRPRLLPEPLPRTRLAAPAP
jgi:cytochrome c-type biogenesis protein CcmF